MTVLILSLILNGLLILTLLLDHANHKTEINRIKRDVQRWKDRYDGIVAIQNGPDFTNGR